MVCVLLITSFYFVCPLFLFFPFTRRLALRTKSTWLGFLHSWQILYDDEIGVINLSKYYHKPRVSQDRHQRMPAALTKWQFPTPSDKSGLVQ